MVKVHLIDRWSENFSTWAINVKLNQRSLCKDAGNHWQILGENEMVWFGYGV
jgi:hypothetical protein